MMYALLLFFFFLEYMRPNGYIPQLTVLHLNSLVPLALMIGAVVSSRGVPNREVLIERNTRLLAVLLVMMMFSVLMADISARANVIFMAVLGYVLVYWVICRQLTDIDRVKGVFKVLVLIHVAVAALTPEMFTDPDGRHVLASGSFLGDGNDFALSVNVAMPFCLYLLFDARTKRDKVVWGGLLIFLILSIVATKSRGGTLGLVAVGAYFWSKSNKKIMTGALALVALAAILVVAPTSYFDRMNTISANPQDGSAQGRLTAWGAGTRMALDNPLFGVGLGHFPFKFATTYRPPGLPSSIGAKTAHSIYFLILGEMGFPGLILLVTIIVSNLVQNSRLLSTLKPRADRTREAQLVACLSASLIGFAVGGAFLSAIYYPHLYVIAGLLVAGRRIARQAAEGGPASAQTCGEAELHCHPAMQRRLSARQAS
jgi:putative inorganic carbon (hco3(-)) transporter